MGNQNTRSILQIVVAGYVIYLALSLKDGIINASGREKVFFIVAGIVMIALSLFVIINGIKTIMKQYKEDREEKEEEEQDEENEQDESN